MTRAQRIALAMRGYPKPPEEIRWSGEVSATPADDQWRFYDALMLIRPPSAQTKYPHTFSVLIRGERGLPCS